MKTMSASGWTKHMGSPRWVRIEAAKGRRAAQAASLDTGRLGVTEDLTRATALVHCKNAKMHIRKTLSTIRPSLLRHRLSYHTY